MIQVEEFVTDQDVSPFRRWFDDLDDRAAAWVTIDRGPGYRIYFGWDSKVLVILLGGGTKRRQQSDIATALRHWRSYKARKAAGPTKRK